MQNLSPVFFHDDDDDFDDIDKIFSKLETFEPPADMVSRIMGAVSKLPSPQELWRQQQQWLDMDGLVVRHDDKGPT